MSIPRTKHKTLTLEKKVEVINKSEDGTSISDLASEYGIARQTVRDIIKKKASILTFLSSPGTFVGASKKRRMRGSDLSPIDEAVFKWFQERQAQGDPISGPLLCERARYVHKELQIKTPFVASQGWLQRFKDRHGIRGPQLSSASFATDAEVQLNTPEQVTDDIKEENVDVDDKAPDFISNVCPRVLELNNFVPEQIYNVDVTGLLWKSLPTKLLVGPTRSSLSEDNFLNERIALMACANSNGDHKLKLLVTGTSNHPTAFKTTGVQTVPVVYHYQPKARVTQEILQKWFHENFVPEVRTYLQSRNLPETAVLFLDQASSHLRGESLTTNDDNIFVYYVPSQDQGVMEALKFRYRKSVLRELMVSENISDFCQSWSLKDAIYMMADVWEDVPVETIVQSRGKLDIKEERKPPSESLMDRVVTIQKLVEGVERFEDLKVSDIEEWLLCDETSELGYQLKDDILGRVDSKDDTCVADDQLSNVLQPSVSHIAALDAAQILLKYLVNDEDSSISDVNNIRQLQNKIKNKVLSCSKIE